MPMSLVKCLKEIQEVNFFLQCQGSLIYKAQIMKKQRPCEFNSVFHNKQFCQI